MAIIPKILNRAPTEKKTCPKCHQILSLDHFAQCKSPFYEDSHIPFCDDCVEEWLASQDYNWSLINKLCQYVDIPFIVKEWDRLHTLNPTQTWTHYWKAFKGDEYEDLGWGAYFDQYKALKARAFIDEEIPELRESKYTKLREIWGANYDDNELNYLEDLYKGLKTTQVINGALQIDQARKICKLSLEIDNGIREGSKDVDKLLSSYDKLVKTAEFTPKNTKNAADFDSFAELGMWLEKRGRQNHFYDDVTRDVIDETLKNIEAYNQRLYLTEGGIGEAITERLQALKYANEAERNNFYNLQSNFDLDEYENDGWTDMGEEEDFDVNLGGKNE